jgi:putative membrane protein
MMWGYGSAWSPWMMVLSTFLVLLVIALVVWAVVTLARSNQDSSGTTMDTLGEMPPADTPTMILDRRLARGEIDVETYRATKDAMEHRT